MKKTTYDLQKFIDISSKIHNNKYNYSQSVFLSTNESIDIICPIHGKFTQTAGNHMKGTDCYKCGRKKAVDNKKNNSRIRFLDKCKKLYGDKYSYDKFVSMSKKMEIICPEHGKFLMTPLAHIRGGSTGCRLCGINVRITARRMTFNEFVELSSKTHNNKYEYDCSTFSTIQKKLLITCPEHGKFWQRGACHLKGKRCPKCGLQSRAELRTKTTEQFIKEAKEIHGEEYDYSKVIYSHGRNKVPIICKHHGEFLQTPEGHLSGRGCKRCIHTTSELEIEWLNSTGLPNNDEHRGVAIKIGKKRFILDGYDPITKTAYEYNGDYWHGNPLKYKPEDYNKDAHKTFGELYKATQDKKNLLEANGYTVISIWESEYKNKRV